MLSLIVNDAPVANTPLDSSPEEEKKAMVSCFDNDDDDDESNEYVEEMEPLDESDNSCNIKGNKQRRSKSKGGPDHQWDANNSSNKSNSKDDNDLPASSSPTSKEKNRRSKFSRANSVDGLGMKDFDMPEKRHTWDGSNRLKGKPDFRWDKVGGEAAASSSSSPTKTTAAGAISPPRVRRGPRRAKSDLSGLDRPLLTRTNSKVRFCLNENVCFEVPRTPKDRKPELFYSKREIKVFKAEKKEEKKEKREEKERRKEEKERQKEQQAMMDKLKAKVAETTTSFAAPAPAASTAIAGAC